MRLLRGTLIRLLAANRHLTSHRSQFKHLLNGMCFVCQMCYSSERATRRPDNYNTEFRLVNFVSHQEN